MKKPFLFPAFTFVALPLIALAADVTVCKNGSSERRIEVSALDAEKKAPCEVKYFKEGDNSGKVLWNAQNDAGYCDTKAKELSDKLTSSGWQCSGGAQEAPSPAPSAAPAK